MNKAWYMKRTFKLSFKEAIRILFTRKFSVKFTAPYGTVNASCGIEKEEIKNDKT